MGLALRRHGYARTLKACPPHFFLFVLCRRCFKPAAHYSTRAGIAIADDECRPPGHRREMCPSITITNAPQHLFSNSVHPRRSTSSAPARASARCTRLPLSSPHAHAFSNSNIIAYCVHAYPICSDASPAASLPIWSSAVVPVRVTSRVTARGARMCTRAVILHRSYNVVCY